MIRVATSEKAKFRTDIGTPAKKIFEGADEINLFPNLGRKPKKGLHFESISAFPIFFPNSWCSLKKKGLHFESIEKSAIFVS